MGRFYKNIFTALLVVFFLIPQSFAQNELLPKPPAPYAVNTQDTDNECKIFTPCVKTPVPERKKRILSIDGGGIKSIITLKMLEYIEQQTGQKTGDYFDYIAGTSSGGMLALYLSMPSDGNPNESKYSASDIIDILQYDSKIIFKKKIAGRIFGQKVLQVFRPAYHNKNIEKAMQDRFHNLQMKDATTNILVLTFDTQENKPVAFTNYEKNYNEAFMRDTAIGTSVAPFYLSPLVYHDKKENRDRTLLDGGLVAKNASVYAYCESKNLFPQSDLFILSLGAGYQEKKQYDYQKLKGWGFLRLSLPIYTFMLDGTSNTNDIYLQKLVKADPKDSYYRFQPKLDPKTGFDNKPDNTSDENFNLLIKIADDYIIEHKQELDMMIQNMKKETKEKESI